jgi:hypothetical protein
MNSQVAFWRSVGPVGAASVLLPAKVTRKCVADDALVLIVGASVSTDTLAPPPPLPHAAPAVVRFPLEHRTWHNHWLSERRQRKF